MKFLQAWLAIWLVLSTVAVAERRDRQVPLPPPSSFVQSDSASLSVVRIIPNQPGTVKFMKTCWQELKRETRLKLDPLMVTVFLTLKDRDPLNRILPLQCVRVDRSLSNGVVQPTGAITLAGFRGLQRLFYKSLLQGPDGKPFPIEEVGAGEVALATEWDKPGRARVLTRHSGTFYLLGSLKQAEAVLDTSRRKPNPTYAGWDIRKPGMRGFLVSRGRTPKQLKPLFIANPPLLPLAELPSEVMGGIEKVTWNGNLEPSGEFFSLTVNLLSTSPEPLLGGLKERRARISEGGVSYDIRISTQQVVRYVLDVKA